MSSRLTSKTREEIEHFGDILHLAGNLLELSFIQRAFNHARFNPEGYNTEWIRNALIVAIEFSELHKLNIDDRTCALACILLIESGRQFRSSDPYAASAAFATVFLHRHASHFFDLDDIELIVRCCRQVPFDRIRLSVSSKIEFVVRETLVLTDVIYGPFSKVVINFLRETATPSIAPMATEERTLMLADRFAERYGSKGKQWRGLPADVASLKAEALTLFKQSADDKQKVGDIIRTSFSRIFAQE